jgi:hypothetical protein
MSRVISFEQAKAQFAERFTMEHKPRWARTPAPNGKYYAPQYASDHEWYVNTAFPGEPGVDQYEHHCQSHNQSWPLGHWLGEGA